MTHNVFINAVVNHRTALYFVMYSEGPQVAAASSTIGSVNAQFIDHRKSSECAYEFEDFLRKRLTPCASGDLMSKLYWFNFENGKVRIKYLPNSTKSSTVHHTFFSGNLGLIKSNMLYDLLGTETILEGGAE